MNSLVPYSAGYGWPMSQPESPLSVLSRFDPVLGYEAMKRATEAQVSASVLSSQVSSLANSPVVAAMLNNHPGATRVSCVSEVVEQERGLFGFMVTTRRSRYATSIWVD